jgi:hypothetical protein
MSGLEVTQFKYLTNLVFKFQIGGRLVAHTLLQLHTKYFFVSP